MNYRYGRAGAGSVRRGRGATFAAIVALHALLLAGAMLMPDRERPEEKAVPVQVAFLQEESALEEPPPPPPPQMEPPRVDIPAPQVNITFPPTPVQTITVATRPAPAPPAAPPTHVDGPLLVDAVDYLRAPAPRYPPAARRARVQGTVLVRVLIGTDGRPLEVVVHKSSGSTQLDDAACASVREASFRPHRENGVARSVLALIPVEFSLTMRVADRSRGH